jgi:hypothetical protein
MRLQNSVNPTTEEQWSNPMRRVEYVWSLAQQQEQSHRHMGKIPRSEQDEDRWRFEMEMPGRDPVTEERGMGG